MIIENQNIIVFRNVNVYFSIYLLLISNIPFSFFNLIPSSFLHKLSVFLTVQDKHFLLRRRILFSQSSHLLLLFSLQLIQSFINGWPLFLGIQKNGMFVRYLKWNVFFHLFILFFLFIIVYFLLFYLTFFIQLHKCFVHIFFTKGLNWLLLLS